MAKRENEIDKYLSFAVSVYGFNISAYEKINASNRKFKKLIYLIDKKYVLYFVEKKMFSVNYFKYYPLIFNSMIKSGIEIPKIVKGIDQNEFYYFCNYFCYLVTYLDYPTLNDIVDDNNSALIQMYKFIGLYSNNNKELLDIDFPSILNIDGLHKVCSRVTKKRQCCLDICNELKKNGYSKASFQLNRFYMHLTNFIRKHSNNLFKTFVHGDLNSSNVLVDQQNNFKGFIDFELCGYDYCLNNFCSETVYSFTKKEFLNLNSKNLINRCLSFQDEKLKVIFSNYKMSIPEQKSIHYFKILSLIFSYNNSQVIKKSIIQSPNKVIDFLKTLFIYFNDLEFASCVQSCDSHVHCGFFYDYYFNPTKVIKTLSSFNIHQVWISSTSSCIEWHTDKEKKYLIKQVEKEIYESVKAGYKYKINVVPFYYVVPQRHYDGESIESIINKNMYKGIKIHFGSWGWNDLRAKKLLDDLFVYCSINNLPILVHTGEDLNVHPYIIKPYIEKYPTVVVVLAHCKEPEPIINIFDGNENAYGDISFCPRKSVQKIKRYKYDFRLKYGSDFPITFWYEMKYGNCEITLKENYRNVLLERSSYLCNFFKFRY